MSLHSQRSLSFASTDSFSKWAFESASTTHLYRHSSQFSCSLCRLSDCAQTRSRNCTTTGWIFLWTEWGLLPHSWFGGNTAMGICPNARPGEFSKLDSRSFIPRCHRMLSVCFILWIEKYLMGINQIRKKSSGSRTGKPIGTSKIISWRINGCQGLRSLSLYFHFFTGGMWKRMFVKMGR